MTAHASRLPVLAAVGLMLALAGCTGTSNTAYSQRPVVTQPRIEPVTTASLQPTPAQTTATAVSTTDLSGSIDPAAVRLLNEKDRTDASKAAFYALQFGRAGAPRTWGGASGSGVITVGPEVQSNSITCRNFTHTVTVGGTKYDRKGTACREANGNWSVV